MLIKKYSTWDFLPPSFGSPVPELKITKESFGLSTCLPACLPVCVSMYLSKYVCLCLSVSVSSCLYLAVYVCLCLPVFVCMSLYMSLSVHFRGEILRVFFFFFFFFFFSFSFSFFFGGDFLRFFFPGMSLLIYFVQLADVKWSAKQD